MWDDDDFQTYFEGHFEMWEFLGFDKWLTSLAASPENLVGFLQSPLLLGEKLTLLRDITRSLGGGNSNMFYVLCL